MDAGKIKPMSTTVGGAQSRQRLGNQAKTIMDEFAKALERVENATGEAGIERDEFARKGKALKSDGEFQKRMLKNAPRKEGGPKKGGKEKRGRRVPLQKKKGLK